MLKDNYRVLRGLHMAADLCLTVFAFYLAGLFRGMALFSEVFGHSYYEYYPSIGYLVVGTWFVLLRFNKNYYKFRMRHLHQILAETAKVVMQGMVVLIGLMYLIGLTDQSRLVVALFAALDLVFLLAFRMTVTALLHYYRKKGYNAKSVLVVGDGRQAAHVIDYTRAKPGWGLNVTGILRPRPVNGLRRFRDIPVLGSLDDLPELIKGGYFDYVVFALSNGYLSHALPYVNLCQQLGVTSLVLMDFEPPKVGRWRADIMFKRPALELSATASNSWMLLVKDLLDRSLAAAGLVLVSPLFLVIAALVKLSSPGPVFFKQERCGLNGKRFKLFKFRTMVDGADDMKAALMEKNEVDGPVFKIKNDPRVTRIGRFLRKTSLDELPQLINVLAGHMSLVGPRPPLASEVVQYDLWQRRKLSMKPGITCIWQVEGRNRVPFEEWMKMDLRYIDNWSLWEDAKILARTIPTVISGKGAS